MMKLLVLLSVLFGIVHADEQDGSLEITPLTENVYLHTSYKQLPGVGFFPSNGLIVVNGRGAVLIDTAWPEVDTPKLVEWLDSQSIELKAVIVTHSHDDRTSGLAYLNELNVPTYASEATNVLLESAGEAKATRTFESAAKELRALGIEVLFPGAGHAPDNHVAWIADSKVLFGGCLVRSASTQNLGNTADADIGKWPRSLQHLLDGFPEAVVVVPGHGTPGGRGLIDHSIKLASREAGD